MLPPSDLDRRRLRLLVEDLLRTDPDLERFCLEQHHEVYVRFTSSMDRITKVTLLLSVKDPEDVFHGLRRHFKDQPKILQRLNARSESDDPVQPARAPGAPPQMPAPQRLPPPPGSPYDPAWYVHRDREERLALAHLNTPGAPAVIWGPEKFGRTTLVKHLLERCLQMDEQEGKTSRAIELNLERLDERSWKSFDAFLLNLAHTIAHELELDSAELERFWNRAGTFRDKLNSWMEAKVLQQISGRFILGIDQADAVWRRKSFHDSFFGMLRGWAEDTSDIWTRLRLLISVSTVPTLLVSATTQSPFNNAVTVKLGDLTLAQVRSLVDAYGLSWSDGQLSSLMAYIGGHPYLVRVALYHAVSTGWVPEKLTWDVLEEFFGDHLSRLEIQLQSEAPLLRALGQLLQNRNLRIQPEVALRLTSLGLIAKNDSGNYRIRYRLYEDWLRRVGPGER